jgi:hypothetical protein
VLIWLSVSILFSSPFLLMGQVEPELVVMVFAWMALVILFGLVYCGVMLVPRGVWLAWDGCFTSVTDWQSPGELTFLTRDRMPTRSAADR